MERRDRLRKLMAMMDEDERDAALGASLPCSPRANGCIMSGGLSTMRKLRLMRLPYV